MSNRSRQFCTRLSLLFFLAAWLPLSLAVMCELPPEVTRGVILADCAEMDTHPASPHRPTLPKDCDPKLCLAAKIFSNADWKAGPKLEALAVWLGGWLLLIRTVRFGTKPTIQPFSPPVGSSSSLLYRYCRLLE